MSCLDGENYGREAPGPQHICHCPYVATRVITTGPVNYQFFCVPRSQTLTVSVVVSVPLLFLGQDLGQVSGSEGGC